MKDMLVFLTLLILCCFSQCKAGEDQLLEPHYSTEEKDSKALSKTPETLHEAFVDFNDAQSATLCDYLKRYYSFTEDFGGFFTFHSSVLLSASDPSERDLFEKCLINEARKVKLNYLYQNFPEFSQGNNIGFDSCKKLLEETSLIWIKEKVFFLQLKKSSQNQNLVLKCNDVMLNYMDNEHYTNVTDYDIRTNFLVSVAWSCPKESSFGFENIFMTLFRVELVRIDNHFFQHCGDLMCTSDVYISPDSAFFVKKESHIEEKCVQKPLRYKSFQNTTLHKFKINAPYNFVLLAGHDSSMSVEVAEVLLMMSEASDPEIRHCCKEYTANPIIFFNIDKVYGFCYSVNESCQNGKYLGYKVNIDSIRILVVMNKGYVHSKLAQILAIYNFTQSFSDMLLHMNFQYKSDYHNPRLSFSSTYSFSAVINREGEKNVKRVTQELAKKGIICQKNYSFMICRKDIFHLLFLYNCSLISVFDKSQLILDKAYFNDASFLKTVCQENIEIIEESSFLEKNLFLNIKKGYEGLESSLKEKIYYLLFPLNISMSSSPLLGVNEPMVRNKISRLTGTNIYKLNSTVNVSFQNNIEKKRILKSLKYKLKIMLLAKVSDNNQCLEDLSENRFSVQVDVSKEISFLIGPFSTGVRNSCLLAFPKILSAKVAFGFTKITTINKFWPSCIYNMLVITKGSGSEILDWNYLSIGCQHQERLLLSFSIIITAVIYVGNIFVLFVLLRSGLVWNNPSFMIRFSLSLADLLVGVFPATFAVHNTFALMTGRLTLQDLDTEGLFTDFKKLESRQTQGFQQLRFERTDFYSVFSSIMMNISVCLSILTLCLLSIHNLMMFMERPLKNGHVKLGIAFIWIFGISLSLLVNIREGGWEGIGYFDPISKLTLNIGAGTTSLSSFAFYIQVTLLGVAGILVLTLTIISFTKFRCLEYKARHHVTISQQEERAKLTRQMTKILGGMFLLFVISCSPLLLTLKDDFENTHPVVYYICWWLFIGGSSCNWIIYTAMGSLFRQEARKILDRLCPAITKKNNGDAIMMEEITRKDSE